MNIKKILLTFSIAGLFFVSPVSLNARGENVYLDVSAAPVTEVLRGISQIADVDIVWPQELEGKLVTVKLDNVPWEKALTIILDYCGYIYQKDGNLVRVKLKEKPVILEESLETIVIPLSFAKADTLKTSEVLKALVSKDGKIESDNQTNSLVIIAHPSQIPEIRNLIKKLDIEISQIMIEGYILETNSSYLREMGVNWDFSNIQLMGSAVGDLTYLPDKNIAAPGNFSLGYLAEKKFLATLKFLESKTDTRILSQPRIATINNKEAVILVGKKVPIQTVTSTTGGTTTSIQYIDTGVKLTVTPTLSDNENILLTIHPEVSDIAGEIGGNPIIATSEANTTVLIKTGQTVVIAGLLKESKPHTASGLPFLRKIPVLKWFFGQEKKGLEETRELVFFINTKIIKNWETVSPPKTISESKID
ncbi:MAG: secretin N-terminal domain-containing protein [Candidatus Ratteibacteria bacterium]|jgi:type II secretory pathway component HofQ